MLKSEMLKKQCRIAGVAMLVTHNTLQGQEQQPIYVSCVADACGHWVDDQPADDAQCGHCGLIR